MSASGVKPADPPSIICDKCDKPIQTRDPKQCELCHNYFHTKCISFRSLPVRGVATFACATCADIHIRGRLETTLNSSTQAVSKGNSTTNQGKASSTTTRKKPLSAPPSTSTSRNQSPARQTSTSSNKADKADVTLQDILAALTEIRAKQDEAVKEQRNMSRKISGLEERLGPIELRLRALDDLPLLQTRLEKAEQSITELRAQLQDLSARPLPTLPKDGNNNNSNSTAATPATVIPAEIASLRSELQRVKRQQETSANNNTVVLSGLYYTRETRLDLLAFSVLSALDPSVLRRDIAGARVMGRLNAATATSAADSRPPPIAVTLSSHALVRSTIIAKIKKGKLHTAELDAGILEEAKALAPDHQGLVNINELLPRETHKLRVRARLEAKRRNGCRTYVRDGTVYIRSTEDTERATIITSDEDLTSFLSLWPPDNINH